MKNIETERKFLVDKAKWEQLPKPDGLVYLQGYLSMDDAKVIRVRVAGDRGFLTIKGKSEMISRPEYEYEIPAEDAREIIDKFALSRIEKIRTRIGVGAHTWEVDEFLGDNEGLLMAEIELEVQDEHFELPDWLGEEVTGDTRYYNAILSVSPYAGWPKKENFNE